MRNSLEAIAILACALLAGRNLGGQACTGNSTGLIAIPDLERMSYLGFQGGLYPGGSNLIPPAHLADALSQASLVMPRAKNGVPDEEKGLIGFVSIGMSSLCHKWGMFERLEDPNPDRNSRLVLINGANGGSAADKTRNPADPYWSILLSRVSAAGLSNEQVQVAWFEQAYENPPTNFPIHAMNLQADMTTIMQIVRGHFPNLRLMYVSCRTYGNYAIPDIEPVSYENGFASKWMIEAQIVGDPALNWNPDRGSVVAPLLIWGPYLWADGVTPNGSGLRWCVCDYELCFDRHLDDVGEIKVWQLLHDQLASGPVSQAWYPNRGGRRHVVLAAQADAHVASTAPNQNFGANPELLANGLTKIAFVRFDASSVQRPVLHAKLTFRNLDEAQTQVRTVSDSSWNESTIRFNNAPAIDGATIFSMPVITRDGTRSVDVTEAINADADGIVTFALRNLAAFDSAVHSKEGGQAPTLVLVPTSLPKQTLLKPSIVSPGRD